MPDADLRDVRRQIQTGGFLSEALAGRIGRVERQLDERTSRVRAPVGEPPRKAALHHVVVAVETFDRRARPETEVGSETRQAAPKLAVLHECLSVAEEHVRANLLPSPARPPGRRIVPPARVVAEVTWRIGVSVSLLGQVELTRIRRTIQRRRRR